MIRHRVPSDECTDWTVLLTSSAVLMVSSFYAVPAHSPLYSFPPHLPAHSFINLHSSTLPPHENIPNPQIPLFPPILSVTKSRCPFPKLCLEFLNGHQLQTGDFCSLASSPLSLVYQVCVSVFCLSLSLLLVIVSELKMSLVLQF